MRFKKFSIIISLALVMVCLGSFVAPSAQALFLPGGGGSYPGFVPYITSTLGDWIISQGFDWMLDQSMDVAGFLGGLIFDDICPYNTDSHRHDFKLQNVDGNASRQLFVCQYCGKYGDEVLNEAYGTPSTNDSEATGYVKKVQDELGTTVIGSSGLQISLLCTSFSESSFHSYIRSLEDTSLGYPFDLYFEVTGSDSYSLKITFDSSFVAPISGFYTRFIEIYSSCHSEFGEGLNESYRYGEDYTLDKYSNYMVAVGPTNYTVKGVKVFTGTGGYSDCSITINLPKGRLSHHFYGRAYYIVEPDNFNLNNYTASIGGISSRPTSFTGDIGIIGDNGQLTKVEGNQIFNETTNNYYNPSTGTTSTVTDWFYDYSDRSYHLTLESGDTVTVTYGDENITIQEGDTTYNVYYIIEGSASTDSCPEGGAHDWQAGETVDATCTVTG